MIRRLVLGLQLQLQLARKERAVWEERINWFVTAITKFCSFNALIEIQENLERLAEEIKQIKDKDMYELIEIINDNKSEESQITNDLDSQYHLRCRKALH